MQYMRILDVIFAAICRELPLSFHFIFVFYCLFVDIFDPHHKICV
jgi:hypothetical protein